MFALKISGIQNMYIEMFQIRYNQYPINKEKRKGRSESKNGNKYPKRSIPSKVTQILTKKS